MRNQFHHYNFCLSFHNTHHKTFELIFLRIKNEASANLSKKHATLGPRTVLPQLVLSSDQCSQRNFPNPYLVLFWSLIQRVIPQISALFQPISNSALVTYRTRQITECRNQEGFPYENNGSSVRTFIFPIFKLFYIYPS